MEGSYKIEKAFVPVELTFKLNSIEDLEWLVAISNSSLENAIDGNVDCFTINSKHIPAQMSFFNTIKAVYKEVTGKSL